METERQSHTRSKPGLLDRVSGLFLSAGPMRAASEAVFLAAILSLGIFLSSGEQPDTVAFDTVVLPTLVVGPLSAMLCAARMRLRTRRWSGGWRETALREVATGAAIVGLVTVPGLVLLVAEIGDISSLPTSLFALSLFVFFWNAGAFVFFRVLAYLWPRWVRLRRSRLRWEMTHTTLAVVAVVSSIVTLAFVSFNLLTTAFSLVTGPTAQNGFTTALAILGIMIFLTTVMLAIVLPPAALVSYFAARRTAERLESLTHGTSGLREGNLSIRVAVDGEDEVSDLQKDFNAMADDLERAMRDLRSERDNVERLLETQRELVASVSHELRTPVATMRGYLESALGEAGENKQQPIPEDLRGDLKVMSREVVRLQRLIDDLFVLSRAETGRLPLENRPTDVSALLARCAEAVSESAWRTGRVEVIQNADANLPPALVDEGRLEQTVRNLLSNAVRHTPPGGIVALSAAAETDAIAIEVKDTGEGISPEDLDHVFERFYRADVARQRDHSGAGLGLALVKELTQAMGGSVHVESEPGSGSRFILRFPRA